MPSLSKFFKGKDSSSKKPPPNFVNGATPPLPPGKPQWSDAWIRTRVDPEEVAELLSGCTQELKSRGLDIPFLLLPFRPTSDPSAARSFVRNYFFPPTGRPPFRGETLLKELRLTEPMVLSSVIKWCWGRLPGGVVTWEAYELFKIGEKDAQYARDAFTTFVPLSVDSEARKQIIFSFFELMAAIAAHGKTNGLGGRKLSRYAGWWAFEHYDTGKGFDVGYRGWSRAANAASHLFFAYLRSMSPGAVGGTKGIIGLPLSLQQLVQATDYPPEAPSQMFNRATKVVMVVDVVSPTPYDLLRRAKNFEYRDDDQGLQRFANYDDPVRALTDECRRVLKCISSTNQSTVSTTKASTSLKGASWSRFEDVGFGSTVEESDGEDNDGSMLAPVRQLTGSKSHPASVNDDRARPTTPSWADFLSSGFVDDKGEKNMLLPPDKVLPPIQTVSRSQSSQSVQRRQEPESPMEPGELANIDRLMLDDAFWWVWISSLAGEEPTSRKAVFGRCALIETAFTPASWLILEEQVKGAAPEPAPGAYVVEKKGFLGFTTKRGRLTRKRSGSRKKGSLHGDHQRQPTNESPIHRTNIAPDQHARVQAAAVELQRRDHEQQRMADENRRGRRDDANSNKTNSVMTMQPGVANEASQAMRWAQQYDKNEIRAKYLGDALAGRGSSVDLGLKASPAPGPTNASQVALSSPTSGQRELPAVPPDVALAPSDKAEGSHLTPSTSTAPAPPSPVSPKDNSPAERQPPETPGASVTVEEDKPPLPPTPPPSDKAAETSAPPPPAPMTRRPILSHGRSSSPPESPATPASQGRSAVESPSENVEPSPSLPKKAVENSWEHHKLTKHPPGSGKTRGLFGSRRGAEPSSPEPGSPQSGDVSPAAAAARAALAAKASPTTSERPHRVQVETVTKRPPAARAAPDPTVSEIRPSAPKLKHPSPEALSEARRPGHNSADNVRSLPGPKDHAKNAPTRPSPESIPLPVSFQGRPDAPPLQPSPENIPLFQRSEGRKDHPSPRPKADRKAEATESPTVPAAFPSRPSPAAIPLPPSFQGRGDGDGPRTRHDSDQESLSPVNADEKEQADREFSTFDQGPLLEQPAFVSTQSPVEREPQSQLDSPSREAVPSKAEAEPVKSDPAPAASAPLPTFSPEADRAPRDADSAKKGVSPVQDRWAQIRRNAADRVVRESEEAKRPSEKAKGGVADEPSGEETIESRVARIKARVAELTGNMEGPPR